MGDRTTDRDLLEAAVQSLGFEPEHDAETGQVRAVIAYHKERPLMGCTARIDREREVLVVTAIMSQPIPDDRLVEVVEFATRMNYSLDYGSLDVNVDEGWVQFRAGVAFGKAALTEPLVRAALEEVVLSFQRLLDPLVEILEEGTDAVTAWQNATGEP